MLKQLDQENWWDLVSIEPGTMVSQKRLSNAMWASILKAVRSYEFRLNCAVRSSNRAASDYQLSRMVALCDIASNLHAIKVLDQRFNRNFRELYEVRGRMQESYNKRFKLELLSFPE